MINWLKTLSGGGLDLLFPQVCQVCSKKIEKRESTHICKECLIGVQRLQAPFCSCCGIEICSSDDNNHLCADCLKNNPPFASARSLFFYDEEIRVLISKFKYQKDTSITHVFIELMRGFDLSCYMSCDYIVPVPLHRKRVQQRGFNQALLLARACFGKTDERITPSLLQRTVNTAPQVSLEGRARRKSLKNVFQVNPAIDISNSTICLIDDVYTTGTTVSECTRALIRAGAAQVMVFTLARVRIPQRGRK